MTVVIPPLLVWSVYLLIGIVLMGIFIALQPYSIAADDPIARFVGIVLWPLVLLGFAIWFVTELVGEVVKGELYRRKD